MTIEIDKPPFPTGVEPGLFGILRPDNMRYIIATGKGRLGMNEASNYYHSSGDQAVAKLVHELVLASTGKEIFGDPVIISLANQYCRNADSDEIDPFRRRALLYGFVNYKPGTFLPESSPE